MHGSGAATPSCNGVSAVVNSGGYTQGVDWATSTFTLVLDSPHNRSVRVEVVRDRNEPVAFQGKIVLHGLSADEAAARVSERYEEYTYTTANAFIGADVMFVVDRSGSIEGDRTLGSETGEWAELLEALDRATSTFMDRVPQPLVGYVTFGTDASDTGVAVNDVQCAAADLSNGVGADCFLVPEQQLSATPDPSTLVTTESHTNMSLGIALAGLELMGKFYPNGTASSSGTALYYPVENFEKGEFERIAAETALGDPSVFDALPNQLPQTYTEPVSGNSYTSWGADRQDSEFPDYIILITDGTPNALISHEDGLSYTCTTELGTSLFRTYDRGDVKLFQTNVSGGVVASGCLLRDTGAADYYYCDDRRGSAVPVNYNDPLLPTWSFPNSTWPHQPMCNTSRIVAHFKERGIRFGVIAVGITTGSFTEDWLRDYVASLDDDGNPMYVYAPTFSDITTALGLLEGQITLTHSR
jgi:hypothetical protein